MTQVSRSDRDEDRKYPKAKNWIYALPLLLCAVGAGMIITVIFSPIGIVLVLVGVVWLGVLYWLQRSRGQ